MIIHYTQTKPRRTPQGVRGLKLLRKLFIGNVEGSHSARSAWIETFLVSVLISGGCCRTPQGVRGLKLTRNSGLLSSFPSHSARSAWIETFMVLFLSIVVFVALRKECVD